MIELQPFHHVAKEIIQLLRLGVDFSLHQENTDQEALLDDFIYQENGYTSVIHIQRARYIAENVLECRESDENDGWSRFFDWIWLQFGLLHDFSSRYNSMTTCT